MEKDKFIVCQYLACCWLPSSFLHRQHGHRFLWIVGYYDLTDCLPPWYWHRYSAIECRNYVFRNARLCAYLFLPSWSNALMPSGTWCLMVGERYNHPWHQEPLHLLYLIFFIFRRFHHPLFSIMVLLTRWVSVTDATSIRYWRDEYTLLTRWVYVTDTTSKRYWYDEYTLLRGWVYVNERLGIRQWEDGYTSMRGWGYVNERMGIR